jgi:oligopeptidase A
MTDTTDRASNPLLDFSDLPRFAEIRPEHIGPALDVLLAQAQAAVARAEDGNPATWASAVEALEVATEPLGRAWGVVGHLSAVADTPELRKAHADNLPRMTEFWSSLGQNLALYEVQGRRRWPRVRRPFAGAQATARQRAARFPPGRRRTGRGQAALCRDPGTAGATVEGVLRPRARRHQWLRPLYRGRGTPVRHAGRRKEAAALAAQKDGKAGWKFTLHFPSYFPVLQYADDRALRQTMYAPASRALGTGPAARQWSGRLGQHGQYARATDAAP